MAATGSGWDNPAPFSELGVTTMSISTDTEPRNRFRSEFSAAEVTFREQGSRRIQQGADLQIAAERVTFETDAAVVPGAGLRLRVPERPDEPHPLEAIMEVEQVDVRPGNRFRVSGRLRRDD